MDETLPLSRFRVLDLTRVRSGPTAVRQFADWGADVIMVEPKGARSADFGERHGSDFQNLNRNKRSIEIDLKRPKGRDIFYRLVQDADVVFENFRPDVKHRLGIDYETVQAINPRIVYTSISGFGQDGPYADRPGMDQIIQGMGGLMSVTGLPGQGPVRAGIAIADSSAGLYAALGTMTALLEREVTGRGRWVRTSLLESQIALLDFQAARWLMEGEVAAQAGNDHPVGAPMGLFAASDGHINIAAAIQPMFEIFCRIAGAEKLLADPRFVNMKERLVHRIELNDEVARIIAGRSSAEWVEALNKGGVPCGPVNRIDEAFADPQLVHVGMTRAVTHPDLGDIELVSQPFALSGVELKLRSAAPDAGQHSRDILLDIGLADEDIADLKEQGII